jgi:hypothetical protein
MLIKGWLMELTRMMKVPPIGNYKNIHHGFYLIPHGWKRQMSCLKIIIICHQCKLFIFLTMLTNPNSVNNVWYHETNSGWQYLFPEFGMGFKSLIY